MSEFNFKYFLTFSVGSDKKLKTFFEKNRFDDSPFSGNIVVELIRYFKFSYAEDNDGTERVVNSIPDVRKDLVNEDQYIVTMYCSVEDPTDYLIDHSKELLDELKADMDQ